MSLTNNELMICLLIAKGERTKKIAESLGVSSRTVEKHRQQIRRKLELTGTTANLQSYLRSINKELINEAKARKANAVQLRSMSTQ
jgi:DNA-binding NarL/FixJ family response regulator